MKINLAAIVFGLFFVVMGGALFYWSSYDVIINSYESKNWPTVEGVVVASSVDTRAGEDKDLYNLVFSVEYKVGGESYLSNGPYLAKSGASSWVGDRYDFVRGYPIGSVVKVYYAPEKPYVSTIKPGFQTVYLEMILFSGLFFFLGFLMVASQLMKYIKDLLISKEPKQFV